MQDFKILKNNKIYYVLIAILGILAAISVIKGCINASIYSQDFQWDAAKALSMKINPYDESLNPSDALKQGELDEFYDYFESIDAPQKMEANQFPSLLMLLFPMTVIDPSVARIVWMGLNLVFTVAIIWLLRNTFLKSMDKRLFIISMLLMLAGTPYRNQLGVGQHTLFAFAFFLLAVYLADVDKLHIGTSVALAVSYFKYTLTAPLVLYFIYKKKYKEIAISIAYHIILTVCAAVSLGEPILDMIKKPLVVASALSSEGGIDLGAVFGGSAVSLLLAAMIALLLFIMTLMAPKGSENYIFALALLWSLVLTYHRTYDFFVLSAVSSMFLCSGKICEEIDKNKEKLWIYYAVVIIASFFVLRVFSENLISRIVVGILYYGFTIIVTYILYKIIKDEKNGQGRKA